MFASLSEPRFQGFLLYALWESERDKVFETESIGHRLLRMLTAEEVFERYSDLERFEISDLSAAKYVPIKRTENDGDSI